MKFYLKDQIHIVLLDKNSKFAGEFAIYIQDKRGNIFSPIKQNIFHFLFGHFDLIKELCHLEQLILNIDESELSKTLQNIPRGFIGVITKKRGDCGSGYGVIECEIKKL